MSKETLGVFIDVIDAYDIKDLEQKLFSIKKKYNAKDYLIFSNFFNVNNFHDWGLLTAFYMKFFDGKIVFLNEKDIEIYKDATLAECVLYEDK